MNDALFWQVYPWVVLACGVAALAAAIRGALVSRREPALGPFLVLCLIGVALIAGALTYAATEAHGLDVPRPTPTVVDGMLVCPECPRYTLLGPAPSPAPTPKLCGPLKIQVKDPATCAARGLVAPCKVRCGRLCWRSGRGEWEWLGCKPLQRLWSTPTPAPAASPTPRPTPTVKPTVRWTPSPGPTLNACDRGEPGWCYYWRTGKCVRPCPED